MPSSRITPGPRDLERLAKAKMDKVAPNELRERQDPETQGHLALASVKAPILAKSGWRMSAAAVDGLGLFTHKSLGLYVLHSIAREKDGKVWAHVSVSTRAGTMPSWPTVVQAWHLFHPEITGVVVIPVEHEHYSFAEVAHVWGCLSHASPTPDFRGMKGTL